MSRPGGYPISGEKAWITHGGLAGFYALFARTSAGTQGISCFLVPGDIDGLTYGAPEDKMGHGGCTRHRRFLSGRSC